MTFHYPLVLLLLVVPAGLLVWVWLRPGQQIVLPFDHGRPGRGWGWRIVLELAESLPALLLAVAIVLLAGPQRYGEPQAKRKLTNIQLCMDISFSMTRPFGDGSYYDAAMQAAEDFLSYRQGDAVGLTFFGNNILHWCPLTSDTSAIRCAPPFMRPEKVPQWFQGTTIGKALRSCKTQLVQRPEGDRTIILVTDGLSADLSGGNAEQIAKEMKDSGITVFAIIIGMSSIQDEVVTITSTTGGEAFIAGDPEGMKSVFHRIDQMKQAPLEKNIAEALDWFAPVCLAGLGLLGLSCLTAFGLRYTPW